MRSLDSTNQVRTPISLLQRDLGSCWKLLLCISLVLLSVGCLGCYFDVQQLALNNGLSVGDQAPEIVGVDLDGNPMKLSDFRGKVVLLDFFGDW